MRINKPTRTSTGTAKGTEAGKPPANGALAATLALGAMAGTLAIWQPRLAELQASLHHAALTGDVSAISAMAWNDDEDEEQESYQRFGAVAVVTISGVLLPTSAWWMRSLGYRSTPEIAEAICAAGDDANIKTIVLKIESPGGNVQGIAELADTVTRIGKTKRIISYTSGLCCSAAYWVASQTARVYASRLADIGCVGTLFVVSDYSDNFKDMGVRVDAITSTGAETYKGAGTYGTAISPEQKADFKRICDECQVHFTAAVANGRFGGDLVKAQALATGQVHVGPAAKLLGLVDEIVPDTFDDWLSRLSGAEGADYDDDAPSPPESEDCFPSDDRTARSGKEKIVMTFADFSASLAALFTKTGGKFDDVQVEAPVAPVTQSTQFAPPGPTAPTAAETELQKFRDEAAARLTARRTATTAIATTAFGTKNPAAFSAMQTAIAAATDEGTLAALEAACAVATPSALTQSHRVSSGQRIDEDGGEGDDAATSGAPNVRGINTSAIYKARAQAMRGGRN